MTTYIHYGSSKFHPFFPVRNSLYFPKPNGGLWASPVDAPLSWEKWCRREHEYLESLKKYFKFTLTEDAKILHLYSANQLNELPQINFSGNSPICFKNLMYTILDFEKIQQEYDGIELHLSEEVFPEDADWSYRGLYWKLYGWDCDCILILNTNVVNVI